MRDSEDMNSLTYPLLENGNLVNSSAFGLASNGCLSNISVRVAGFAVPSFSMTLLDDEVYQAANLQNYHSNGDIEGVRL
jgi:hypothetical protein